MKVYAILAEGELHQNFFTTYSEALDEVKRMYPEWDDREEEDGDGDEEEDEYGEEYEYAINEVEVKEGHKINNKSNDDNLTELYIEKGINIYIRKLVVKPKSAGGYSRRRKRKGNTKSRKHRI